MAHAEFTPPSPEQVEHHLYQHPPVATPWLKRIAPLGVLLLALILSPLIPSPAGVLLPWVALLGVVIYLSRRTAHRRSLVREAMALHELVTLRHYVQALRNGWSLLPRLVHMMPLHGQTVAAMAHSFDQLRLDEQSLVCYDFMIRQIPEDHPAAMQLSVSRAIAALNCDQLSDAEDALRRVRPAVAEAPEGGFTALYEMARLVQSTATYHYDDVIDQSEQMIDALRSLGIDAGYGHGLIALAYLKQAQRPPREADGLTDPPSADALLDNAQQWWSRATLLVPVDALTFRFPALADVHQHFAPPTPMPIPDADPEPDQSA